MAIYHVALPIPTRQGFDYIIEQSVVAGIRVVVPFGSRRLVGVVLRQVDSSEYLHKLKPVVEVLDQEPVLDDAILTLCHWISQYYHHPIGEVISAALPVALRKNQSAQFRPVEFIRLMDEDNLAPDIAPRAIKQRELYDALLPGPQPLSRVKQDFSDTVIKGLIDRALAQRFEQQIQPDLDWKTTLVVAEKPTPNVEQALAISVISDGLGRYSPTLLEGVTGSGKTEVYLQCIEEVLKRGQQALVLVPEIGLTPQTVSRFEKRFGLPVGMLHSNLTDNERLQVWQQSRSGQLPIVIGTRSAIFTPMQSIGMIIVDEEHDGSYKQQDGLRYNARDIAVMRAREHKIPLILGSATPSLESLNNGISGKYRHLLLQQRAGNAAHAKQNILDITNQSLACGLAAGLITQIEQHLKQGSQVMLFINRRGFAPALLCHKCGFVEDCQRCNRPFTLHRVLNNIQCHHCGAARPIPKICRECGHQEMTPQGIGTEQLEQGLKQLFPNYSSTRIDSDSARGKAKLNNLLDEINHGKHQILIGTQILSKGHHFPNVTLVVIMDADGALFSADFRAAEHLAQLITQLSGRAGRADKPGEMWLQTHQPGHPLLQDLVNNGYGHFARFALTERKQAGLPPFTHQALFRAEAAEAALAFDFLADVGQLFGNYAVYLIGPIPALMEKRQGRFRMQLLVQANSRVLLHQAIGAQIPNVENLTKARKVRWSLDIDPQDFT